MRAGLPWWHRIANQITPAISCFLVPFRMLPRFVSTVRFFADLSIVRPPSYACHPEPSAGRRGTRRGDRISNSAARKSTRPAPALSANFSCVLRNQKQVPRLGVIFPAKDDAQLGMILISNDVSTKGGRGRPPHTFAGSPCRCRRGRPRPGQAIWQQAFTRATIPSRCRN